MSSSDCYSPFAVSLASPRVLLTAVCIHMHVYARFVWKRGRERRGRKIHTRASCREIGHVEVASPVSLCVGGKSARACESKKKERIVSIFAVELRCKTKPLAFLLYIREYIYVYESSSSNVHAHVCAYPFFSHSLHITYIRTDILFSTSYCSSFYKTSPSRSK